MNTIETSKATDRLLRSVAMALALVCASSHAANLTWVPTSSGTWDTTTPNWTTGVGTTTFTDGDSVTFNKTPGGTITIPSTVSPSSITVSAPSGTYTFNGGPIAGGSLTKSGGGILNLNGANTYSGDTTLNAGTLRVDSDTALGSGTLIINGGTFGPVSSTAHTLANHLQINSSFAYSIGVNPLTLTGPVDPFSSIITFTGVAFAGQGALIIGGNISGSGGITQTGAGHLTLSGSLSYSGPTTVNGGILALTGNNTYSGDTTLNVGTLRVDSDTALGSGTLIINGGTFGPLSSTAHTLANHLQINSSFAYSIGVNPLTLTGPVDPFSSIITFTGVAFAGQGALIIGGNISGSGGITQTGAGHLTLSGSLSYSGPITVNGGILALTGNNSYSGDTTLNAGTLRVDSDTALGGGTLIINGGTFGPLSSTAHTLANHLQINSSFAYSIGVNPLTLTGPVDSFSSIITFTGIAFAGQGALIIGGNISGSGGITQTGAGTLTLSGSDSYTGGTIVNDGTLRIGANDSLPPCEALTVNSAGTFNLNGFNQRIGSLSGSGPVVFGNKTLTAGCNNASTTYSGVISGTSGNLTKIGDGTFTLAGASTYTGFTTVNDGTLVINGSLAVASPVAVNAGAVLAGTGTVGPTMANSGGVLSPGDGGPGIIHTRSLNLLASSTLQVQLNGLTAGPPPGGYSQVDVVGTVSLSGADLQVFQTFTPACGNQFVIINNDLTDPVVGQFRTVNGAPILTDGFGNQAFVLGNDVFEILYNGGSGNDVTLVKVCNLSCSDPLIGQHTDINLEHALEAPIIHCPANIIAECTGSAGAQVSFTVTADEECDANPVVICSPASGFQFPMGDTPVVCTASDHHGVTANCSFTVTVRDTTPPVFIAPPPMLTIHTDRAPWQAVVGNAKTITFSTRDDGRPITVPPWDTGFASLMLSGVEFLNVRSYWDAMIYVFPNQTLHVNLPPGTFAWGTSLCPFYGGPGTTRITLSTGEVFTHAAERVPWTEDFFGVVSTTPISWVEFVLPSDYLLLDNFSFSTTPVDSGFDAPIAVDGCCADVRVTLSSTVTGAGCPQVTTLTWLATDCSGNTATTVRTVTLTDTVPPVITTPPSSQTVCKGNPVTFGVSALANQALSYQWQRNGVAVVGATSSTYTIPNIQLTDAANYTVVVSANCGSATSSPATLTVIECGTIAGNVFAETDFNCVKNDGEPGLLGWQVQVNSTAISATAVTDGAGHYSVNVPSGNYTISPVIQPGYAQTCPLLPGTYQLHLENGQLAGGKNFTFLPRGGSLCPNLWVDVKATYPGLGSLHPVHIHGASRPCCGADMIYNLQFGNNGAVAASGAKIQFAYPGIPVGSIVSVTPSANCSGMTISPFIANANKTCPPPTDPASGLVVFTLPTPLLPDEHCTIAVRVHLCCDVTALCASQAPLNALATISPLSPEECNPNQVGNVSPFTVRPCCSRDPNDCTVTPTGCGPEGFIHRDQALTYLVQFQNEGGGAANLVVVRNILDEDLDLATLEILGSSHQYLLQQNGRELLWVFPNIELAPEKLDEEGSRGFVTFRIRPRADAPDGTAITNSASVFFDNNEPVVTIITTNTITENPVPVAAFTFMPHPGSAGAVFDFLYTGGTPGAQCQWSFGPDAIPQTSTELNPTGVSFTGIGTHLVGLETSLGACAAEPAVQVVTVEDRTPPVITGCPANMTVQTGLGRTTCSQTATWMPPTASGNSGVASFTSTHNPGDTFPVGTTTVTYTVTDGANPPNTSTCSFTVTVADNTPPTITCPVNLSVGCSVERLATVSYPAPTVFDNCDAHPNVTCTLPSGSASFAVGLNPVVCAARDASGNTTTCSFTVTRAALGFTGFLSPIGGEVSQGTGGSFADPLRAFKLGSTIPVKFQAVCGGTPVATGVHTLQAKKHSNSVDPDPVIDATPTDGATTGNQFRLTNAASGEWHFNLDTKPLSVGTWKLSTTLSDGSPIHEVWITIKK